MGERASTTRATATFVERHAHRERDRRGADLECPGEDRDAGLGGVGLEAGQLEHFGLADLVGEDHAVAVAIEAPVAGPFAGHRAVAAAVAAEEAAIAGAGVGRVGPAGAVGVVDVHTADEPGMDRVLAVEADPVPVDEAGAGPGGGQAERVVLVEDPRPPARDTPLPRVEPDGDPLVGDVRQVLAGLDGRHQARAVIHRDPRLDRRRRRAAGVPLRQPVDVPAIDRDVLPRVVRLEERLADVVDDVVLLPGDHPGLRRHLAEAVGDGPVEAVGIAAVPERRGGEPRGVRQRAGLILGAVAVGADAGVDRLAALEARRAQVGDEPGVIEPALVLGQRRRDEGRIRPQRPRPRRAVLGDFHQVPHQVEELLARGHRIDQPGRHQRRPARSTLLDVPPGNRDGLAVAGGVAEDDRVGAFLGQQAGDRPAVVGGDRHRLITFLDDLRRLEDRLDEISGGDVLADRGEVGAEGRRRRVGLLADVAAGAGQGRLVEHQGAAAGVAELPGVIRQRGWVLAAELRLEWGRRRVVGIG